jgi:hypothetical protein
VDVKNAILIIVITVGKMDVMQNGFNKISKIGLV